MPRIKSAKKRVLVSHKRHAVNIRRKSAVRTAIKKVIDAIESNNIEQAKELFVAAESHLARAKGKGVMHKNTADRKISRLAQRVVKASKAQPK